MSKEEQEFKKEVDETLYSIYSKIDEDEKIFLSYLVNQFNRICESNNKAIDLIEKSDYSKMLIGIDLLKILKEER